MEQRRRKGRDVLLGSTDTLEERLSRVEVDLDRRLHPGAAQTPPPLLRMTDSRRKPVDETATLTLKRPVEAAPAAAVPAAARAGDEEDGGSVRDSETE